jgi:hypothetical protein
MVELAHYDVMLRISGLPRESLRRLALYFDHSQVDLLGSLEAEYVWMTQLDESAILVRYLVRAGNPAEAAESAVGRFSRFLAQEQAGRPGKALIEIIRAMAVRPQPAREPLTAGYRFP